MDFSEIFLFRVDRLIFQKDVFFLVKRDTIEPEATAWIHDMNGLGT